MSIKPWYRVVTPREDLREGKPLDASEFAVHLDQVRDGRAPEDYPKPERFFERTYLTQNPTGFAAEVIRRLSGIKTETLAVFNVATAFGGKTHALSALYPSGTDEKRWVDGDRTACGSIGNSPSRQEFFWEKTSLSVIYRITQLHDFRHRHTPD